MATWGTWARVSAGVIVVLGAGAASVGCGDADPPAVPTSEPGDDTVPGPDVDEASNAPPLADDEPPLEEVDAGRPAPTVACKKKITVVATVGVPGKSKYKTNGCWDVIVTDGAAVKDYRKCSTSSYVVNNATGTSYAYDDTSPDHPLAQEKSFLQRCAAGATGDGWEFMAYRRGWRFLDAPRLKAYFAELYGSATTDIDSLWYVDGVYRNNPGLKSRTRLYPMINSGPPKASNLHAKMGAEALKICRTVKDGGYFGIYNASWREGMPVGDPRLEALQRAMNDCTTK